MFEQKYDKYQSFFLSENFQFLEVKFSIYLNRCVFVMVYAYGIDNKTLERRLVFYDLVRYFISFLVSCKKNLLSERYTANILILYKTWILHDTEPMLSNQKLIAFWRNFAIQCFYIQACPNCLPISK